MIKYAFFILSFISITVNSNCQLNKIDSLQIDSLINVIETSNSDSLIIDALETYDYIIYPYDADLDKELNSRIIAHAENSLKKIKKDEKRLFFQSSIASSTINLGIIEKGNGNFDKALILYNKGEELYRQINDSSGIANVLNNKGLIYDTRGNYIEAISLYKESLIYRGKELTLNTVRVYLNLGLIFLNTGFYSEAIKHVQHGIILSHELGNESELPALHNNLGLIYFTDGQNDLAVKHYKLSLDFANKLNQEYDKIDPYLNLGNVHSEQSNTDSTLYFYKKAIDLSKKYNDNLRVASITNNIGLYFKDRKEYDSALYYYDLTLNSDGIKQDLILESGVYSNIGVIYQIQGDLDKALKYNLIALAKNDSTNDLNYKRNINYVLYEIYKKKNNHKKSIEHFEKYVDLNDSLNRKENLIALSNFKLKQIFKQERELDSIKSIEALNALTIDNLTKDKRNNLLLFVTSILLILIILLVLFFMYRKRALLRQNEINTEKEIAEVKIETQENERKRISKELHDKVVSNLVARRFSLAEKIDKEIDSLLESTIKDVRDVSYSLLEKKEDAQSVQSVIKELIQQINSSNQLTAEFISQGNLNNISKSIIISIIRVVQEAISNCIKHAEAKHLTIQLIEYPDSYFLSIEDDGKGFDEETIKNGLGLNNMKERINNVNGDISFDSSPSNGLSIIINIPKL